MATSPTILVDSPDGDAPTVDASSPDDLAATGGDESAVSDTAPLSPHDLPALADILYLVIGAMDTIVDHAEYTDHADHAALLDLSLEYIMDAANEGSLDGLAATEELSEATHAFDDAVDRAKAVLELGVKNIPQLESMLEQAIAAAETLWKDVSRRAAEDAAGLPPSTPG